MRDLTLKSSYDEAVIINLEQVPKEVGAIVLQVRVPKVQIYAAQDTAPEGLQFSEYGVIDWIDGIWIDQVEINKDFNLKDLIK